MKATSIVCNRRSTTGGQRRNHLCRWSLLLGTLQCVMDLNHSEQAKSAFCSAALDGPIRTPIMVPVSKGKIGILMLDSKQTP